MKNRIVFWISIFAVILFGGKIGKKNLFTRLRLIKFDLQTFHNYIWFYKYRKIEFQIVTIK